MARVGFIGMGVMGAPMAGHLLTAGHEVTVWNRTSSKCMPLVEQGATQAETLADFRGCSIVILCVAETADVRDVCLALGADEGTLIVDHSTVLPAGAVEIHAEMAARGLRFLDAPITGGSMGAQKGALTVFCGGSPADYAEAEPVMAAYSKRTALVGGPGAGQMMKMANQIAVGGALLALCESLAFAQRAGLDLAVTRELLGGGAAGSWAFENYGPKILARDWSPGFSVDHQRKDFRYCMETAAELGAAIPGTELTDRLLAALTLAGRGGDTTAALFEVYEEMTAG